MMKIKNNYGYFIIAVVLATAFFAHETIVSDYTYMYAASAVFNAKNEQNTLALKNIKKAVKGTPVYNEYLIINKEKNEAHAALMGEYDKLKFLEFKTFRQFLGEFGWAFGLFIYGLFNLIKAFIRKTKTFVGEVALHTTIIFISIFFMRWCFKHEDFMQVDYILINLFTALSLCYAAHLFIRVKERLFYKFKNGFHAVSAFMMKDAKKFVDKDKLLDYKKEYVGALKKGTK